MFQLVYCFCYNALSCNLKIKTYGQTLYDFKVIKWSSRIKTQGDEWSNDKSNNKNY